MIERIDACRKTDPQTGRPVPGHFASRFSSYADVEGCRIPMRIMSEVILPEGEYVCVEYAITHVAFNALNTVFRGRSR
jgi:hypothetical protein